MAHFIFHQRKLKQNIQYLRTIFTEKNLNFNIFYSVKTNFSKEVLTVIHESNANFEIVSQFEWEMVKKFKPKTLVLNGPSKSKELVESIINSGVEQLYFNVDNDTDLLILKNLDEKIIKKIKIGIRVYLNKEGIWNRFGFEVGSELLENIIKELGVNIKGFHFHFSTNNFKLENYKCILLELKNIQNATMEKYGIEDCLLISHTLLIWFDFLNRYWDTLPHNYDDPLIKHPQNDLRIPA